MTGTDTKSKTVAETDRKSAVARRPTRASPDIAQPEAGEVRGFLYDPRSGKVEFNLEDDRNNLSVMLADADAMAAEPLATRPWGQTDFRLIDPDGYYVRVTSAG